MLLDQAAKASAQLSQRLEESNTGPVTIEHLQLRVAGFARSWEHTPNEQMFGEALDQRRQVAALLEGRQPRAQRQQLHRIAGQLTVMLAGCSFDVGGCPATYAHCLTAAQLARETGDDGLLARVRMWQSTAALWDHDPRLALHYAQDVRRAWRAMPAEAASGGPDDAVIGEPWSPGVLELYTGITLLWLGQADQAEPHARQAIACYRTAPPVLASSANHSQAQINLAICLAGQDQPDEGMKLASEAVGFSRGDLEANLQQASELLAALKPAHRDLPAARDLAERLRSPRTPSAAPNPG
ncbi:MAG: hypothetical protein ACRDYX_17845 [Egibacteraceae bacterium]